MASSGSKSALVTGAASGIGRRLAGLLAAQGYEVCAADLRLEALEAARAADAWSSAISCLRLDVTSGADWEAALAQLPRLDALIHCAGYLKPGALAEASCEDVSRHFDVNAKGTILGTVAASRRMGPGGHVICFGSLAALMPVPGIALYSASKHAVRAFALAASEEFAPRGISVTVLCPGPVRTPMLDAQLGSPEAALTFAATVFEPEEIAAAVLSALERRPLEVRLPALEGALASLANAFPWLWRWTLPGLRRKGLKIQAALQGTK